MTYSVRTELKPSNLNGISEEQIDQHWKLYEGYVAQSNGLVKELNELRANGKGGEAAYADRRRRFGFEYCGMVLHEFYFGNLKSGVSEDVASDFKSAAGSQFGSWESWKEDFAATGKSRGIGWAICYMDPVTGSLTNHFIASHEEGNIPSFHPIVVMDVWEHAYMVDHKASGRPDYISAFMSNINWEVVEKRFKEACEGHAAGRFKAGMSSAA